MEEEEVVCERRLLLETLRGCQERKDGVVLWDMHLGKCIRSKPSPELGQLLVSHLFSNNNPSLWKFIHYALSSSNIIFPLHLLSILSFRVILQRQTQPGAYRLYLELLRRHAVSFNPVMTDACKEKIIKSIDAALQLSKTFGVEILELGQAQVLFLFTTVVRLIDGVIEDCGLQVTVFNGAIGAVKNVDYEDMDVDIQGDPTYKSHECHEQIRTANFPLVLEVLAEIMENRRAMVLLRLVHLNMPEKFNTLLQKIQFLDAHKLSSSKLKSASVPLSKLCVNIQKTLVLNGEMSKRQLAGVLSDTSTCRMGSCCTSEAGQFAFWVSFDICMENAMDGKQFPVTSAVNILAETIRTLQVFNGASWQETFLALWLSALRLVQRERDPLEGPVPHLEARLCVLLSITPLAISRVLEDDASDSSCPLPEGWKSNYVEAGHTSREQGLISSIQALEMYSSLLCPPATVVSAANTAVTKAARFLSEKNHLKNGMNTVGCGDNFVKAGGDMRHLIVEACIARNLIDTSPYFWPGYVSASVIPHPDQSPLQRSPWSTFMEGAPLTGPMINALTVTPASSLKEVEKLYHIALNGSEEERPAAAKILCGASLSQGWNIQEHVVRFVVKLLSPPVTSNFTGPRSPLLDHLPMLSSILYGATFIDIVHILSLHGMVPEVAASLIPLCEAFGSLAPSSSQKLSTYDESSVYMVFSSAFLFLLRLWKFYRPPLEQCITGRGGVIGGELTLEYLLLLRNSRMQSFGSVAPSNIHSTESIYIDSYPKLRAWYSQNKSCIASTLSGLSLGNPVHQVANKILNMLFRSLKQNGTSSSNTSIPSTSSVSDSTVTTEESCQIPLLPAWEILEAVPYVLEAVLTACAHGRLSSRDLTTGLRDLVDFLPASLAAIISYFSAEVTRGIWKPVAMNGIDWPSPAANFATVESEIKEILSAAGVDLPSCSSGVCEAWFPLPMAVLVSLTITFKLEKNLEYIHAVVGPALENCASNCPWPGMAMIGSLWAQKVRRWHDFIVVSCSRSVFRENRQAVSQLLRSCFTSFLLGPSSSQLMTRMSGVNGLLGTFISSRGDISPPVAPGFLYLRSCRTIHDVPHVNVVIVRLVAEFASKWSEKTEPRRLKSSRNSLGFLASRAKEVGTLGASLLWVAGGVQLVQELYKETMPTWFLSSSSRKGEGSVVSRRMEGYALAYLVVMAGALVWGVGKRKRRGSGVVGVHMEFVAEVVEGKISIGGCDEGTWKAYVCCLVGVMVSMCPDWIKQVKQETLRKLAKGLKGWKEGELAILLLERGGPQAITFVAQHLNHSY